MTIPNLEWRFSAEVGDEEVHGDVLAVHVLVDPLSDLPGHHVRVQVVVELERQGQR